MEKRDYGRPPKIDPIGRSRSATPDEDRLEENARLLEQQRAKQQMDEGRNRQEAAVEASRLRLRPILMTSFAFTLGVFPLVRAVGAGSEMRQALGTAVFSGMIGVTFFGIFLTPVFFSVIMKLFAGARERGRVTEIVGESQPAARR